MNWFRISVARETLRKELFELAMVAVIERRDAVLKTDPLAEVYVAHGRGWITLTAYPNRGVPGWRMPIAKEQWNL